MRSAGRYSRWVQSAVGVIWPVGVFAGVPVVATAVGGVGVDVASDACVRVEVGTGPVASVALAVGSTVGVGAVGV